MAIQVRHRLLVVEDDARIREVISMVFITSNYETISASNGVAALPMLKRHYPHVLISDLQMPKMDGYELMRITRRFFPETGVIAFSGDFDGSHPPGPELADAFLAKGACTMHDLLECVSDLARKYPVHRSTSAGGLSPSWISPDKKPALWIQCSKCERPFALDRAAMPMRRGAFAACCRHCRSRIRFLVEQRSLDVWISAA